MLDNSAPGTAMGRRNFRRAGREGKYLVGDMCSLPFDDGSFDIVFSDGVLEHFESIERPIKEMVRILKPGGVFAAEIVPRKISCQTLGNVEIFCARLAKRIFSLQIRRAVSESHAEWDIYENSIPPGEYVRMLRQEGVDDAQARASSPFPNLSLPRPVAHLYGRIMLRSKRLADRFESSPSRLAIAWSSTFRVYGAKRA
jgi:ubiquinone/menaquinone biosynthesis C-methylase UbiE